MILYLHMIPFRTLLHSLNNGLFLHIHGLARKSSLLDALAGFFSHAGLFLYVLFFFGYFIATLPSYQVFFLIGFTLASLVFALICSWVTAVTWPHPRPIIAHPTIQTLFIMTQNFKSFPSDHAIFSFTFAFIFVATRGVFDWLSVGYMLFACGVGLSRIIAGVHYPRDILGGILYAYVSMYLISLLYPVSVLLW